MAEILTIGEILVEIMAKEVDQRFNETGEFVGPFASGAPAIFINQAAKTGSKAGIISVIGEDAFGDLNYNKLKNDGVDVSSIRTTKEKITGVAFVTYKQNGDRDFIFHIHDSASGLIGPEDIKKENFEDCQYFHIMGSALFSQDIRQAVMKAIDICKETGTKISFDPNIRKELLLNDPSLKDFLLYVLDHAHLFLPGEDELALLVEADNEEEAIALLFEKGVEHVVVKRGKRGCHAYSREANFSVEPLKVVEVDPTGAGDCFAGTLVSCLNQGISFRESVVYANTAGAFAVTKKGPMEGNTTLNELNSYII